MSGAAQIGPGHCKEKNERKLHTMNEEMRIKMMTKISGEN
jgi:hypothetical protein